MSISSAMNAGVAGLNANATRMASISDNIANSGTYGYKRVETDFSSLVLTEGSNAGKYSAGGVRTSTKRLIDQHGSLIGTQNALDLAVAGRGMLPVTRQADPAGGQQTLLLTHTGSFAPDANGIVRTDQGLILLGWPADDGGNIPSMPRDTVGGLVPIVVDMNAPTGSPTTEVRLGANLPAIETKAGAAGETLPLSVEYYDNLGASESLEFTFTPTVPATGASNEWTMQIHDSASGGAVVGEYVLNFDDSRPGGGFLQSVTMVSGGAYDVTTGKVDLNVAGGPISLDIGIAGQQGGLIQLAGPFSPNNVTRNGAPVSNITGLEVDDGGFMVATYGSGMTKRLYQIPLVDVPNPNGLRALNDQTYQVSQQSGSFFLWDAGTGPAGTVEGYARETSTTDVAAELTSMIETQRAYSSNAKVIQTVDEMLQEATNIKR